MHITYCVGHTAYKHGINSAKFFSSKSAAIAELRNRFVSTTKARTAVNQMAHKLALQVKHGIDFPRHATELWTETPDGERHVIEFRAYIDEVITQ